MQSPSRLFIASICTQPAVFGPQGWADLPDGLLHSVLPLSGSFRDLLAFAATCRSWRAAFSSYPTKSTFCAKFPPLLVQLSNHFAPPDLPNNGRHKLRLCKVIDPINQNMALRCLIPRKIYQGMCFADSSYGQIICCRGGHCLVIDVFSGAEVSPPCLPFVGDCEEELYFSGTLTAPLGSPNSHLLVSTESSLFDWPVGSDSWSELKLSDAWIEQIVEFNGQFSAMDDSYKIYILQLSPKFGLQEIVTEWINDLRPSPYMDPWLAACGNMLLMVFCFTTMFLGWSVLKCIPHRLDTSTAPARWVEVKQLDNWALFVGGDMRSEPFTCISPERWGGRSKRLYSAARRSFVVHGVGDEPDRSAHLKTVYKRSLSRKLRSLWVYPSMFYSDGQ
ncbi:uncharacterized protein LOC100838026 [Brachypodium distachyon]|uniref:F-box domain-containing protein n=1 Tax=Brachypodium distachyon TaxID=15368 RepID=A0A2K2DQQ5_BRADI|nr:uncharacterized protein LOC100838026 [Brachypodium distachyon]PNT76609.1 hypothetical protein BRADI_1g50320v3 [Brachypodium distachyon]|eukprot:XP_003557156.1 uncharacterized protein LOC100838026 [Brachypodium distachyon]